MESSRRNVIAGIASTAGLLAALPVAAAGDEHRRIRVRRSQGRDAIVVGARVRGRGPLVILVPSLGRGAQDYDDLARRLADAGYRTAAVDPRGVGESRGPDAGQTMFDYAEDVFAVASHLSDKPAFYIGHAMGNRVVRALDILHPRQVAGMVLMGGGGRAEPSAGAHRNLDAIFDEALPPEARFAAVKLAMFAEGNDASSWRDGWYPATRRAQMAAMQATPTSRWVGGGTSPVMIMQAGADATSPPLGREVFAKTYPGRPLEVAIVPQAGHAMLPEQPAMIAELILRFLAGK